MKFDHNWLEEMRSYYMYQQIAILEQEPLKKEMFVKLAEFAKKQADIWGEKITSSSQQLPPRFHPGFRCQLVLFLVRHFGTRNLRLILATMKIRGMSAYIPIHQEHQHVGYNFVNNLRAAVFGVNDGLMSILCLILGLVGAEVDQRGILMAGISGILAGAFSMAAGEYVSVRSQRDVYEYQIAIEKQEIEEYPEEEKEELSAIYQSRGLSKQDADQISHLLIKNPNTGLNTLAREELGLNPDELVSPLGALYSSFFSFSLGGLIPILPFLLMKNIHSMLWVSVSITLTALFLIGAFLSLYSNQSPWFNGFRMLAIGCISGSGVFLVGQAINFIL